MPNNDDIKQYLQARELAAQAAHDQLQSSVKGIIDMMIMAYDSVLEIRGDGDKEFAMKAAQAYIAALMMANRTNPTPNDKSSSV